MNKLDKAEGVKDCVKFIQNQIKQLNKEKDEMSTFYNDSYYMRSHQIDALVDVMISLDKYYKKLKHEHEEEIDEI